jgi:thiamine monophosphate kinase
MEKYHELINKAQKEIDSSDHLLFVTYNIVKDSKFVFSVTNKLIDAVKYALEALLEFERKSKLIEPYPKQFNFMVQTFKNKVSERREFDVRTTNFLNKLVTMEQTIDTSSLHFRRGDTYVLADEDFGTQSIELQTIKSYFSSAQEFVTKVGDIIEQD